MTSCRMKATRTSAEALVVVSVAGEAATWLGSQGGPENFTKQILSWSPV